MTRIDVDKLKTPKDIPMGTVLVQHWCNSSTFYQVISSTDKSVTLTKIPSKQTRFEHEGGGTGYAYKMPDFERLEKLYDSYRACCNEYGFDVLSNKATQLDFQNAHLKAKANGKHFWDDYGDIHNNKDCLIRKRIMIKFTKDGFYIPGVIKGSFCGNMQLWNGEEISDYYN